ncbi:hypothetical protein DYB37_011357 [Aphanomyces astaci]|uniref:Uncharacterized protein n=1 Tax=Aphanomyces astaci TaxID=112090 RepID=A0A418FGU4_APHAT|nr:hypothetical protein DYB37_011357 [Aphanomyces astaci]
MPCRRCAALDHQVERCPVPDLHRDKIITLSPTLWAASPNTEFIGKPSFTHWLRDVGAHIPHMPVGTQTAPSVASHEVGTQAVQQADYGTSPETQTCDGSVQTDHLGSLTETTTSTGQYTAAPTPHTGDQVPEAPEQDADHDRILSPREWVSPEQEVQEAGSTRIEYLLGRAPTTIDALYSDTWITSPQAEQPTPGNPGAASGELCQPEFGEEDADSSDMTVTETALAPPAPELESPPADDDLMGTAPVANEVAMVDLSGAPTETYTPTEYQLTGPIRQILKRRSWQEGAVAARGQCCILALYCAKMHHEWSTRSSLDPQVVSGITDLKRSIRDVVQTNPAFLGQYNPRWMQRLTDTSKASQETVEAFMDKFFSRLLAAHPAQGVDKLAWCGVPAGLLTTPINEAAQLEPLLEQFSLTA